MTMIGADHRKLVPIGGIAHAGARGISKVEVQVDGGPWQRAELRSAVGVDMGHLAIRLALSVGPAHFYGAVL